jgi:hypothetical protein
LIFGFPHSAPSPNLWRSAEFAPVSGDGENADVYVPMKLCWMILWATQAGMSAIPVSPPSLKPDPFSDPLIQEISTREHTAVAGNAEATKALATDLEKWTAKYPGNRLLQAYLGSVYTLCSRDAWPGPSKLNYLRDGHRLLNAAVQGDPLNPAVRFVRAIDFYELPAIFGMRQTARDDFKILLQQVDGETKSPYAFEPRTAQAIYYYAGLSLADEGRRDQAKVVWSRGLKLGLDLPTGAKIRAELLASKGL